MKTNILAPFNKTDKSFKFAVNGKVFELKNNELSVLDHRYDESISNAQLALENFDFQDDTIKWYHGPSKFVYNIAENKFKHNDSLIEGNSFTNHVLSAGMVKYDQKNKAELFESLPNLLEHYIVLDFAATFEGNDNRIDAFKLNEKVYISRVNTANQLTNFFLAENANAAVKYIQEKTGESAASFLADLVDGEAKELAQQEQNIKECYDRIAFLKDQRGLLAEADKSITEIKQADQLISEEIKNWENRIKELSK